MQNVFHYDFIIKCIYKCVSIPAHWIQMISLPPLPCIKCCRGMLVIHPLKCLCDSSKMLHKCRTVFDKNRVVLHWSRE